MDGNFINGFVLWALTDKVNVIGVLAILLLLALLSVEHYRHGKVNG